MKIPCIKINFDKLKTTCVSAHSFESDFNRAYDVSMYDDTAIMAAIAAGSEYTGVVALENRLLRRLFNTQE